MSSTRSLEYYAAKYANTDVRGYIGPVKGVANYIIESIAKFLNVLSSDFDVYDIVNYPNGSLVLIHYNVEKNPIEGLRGPVLFVSREQDSFDQRVQLIAPSGPIVEQFDCSFDQKGKIVDCDFDFDATCKYMPSFEGLHVRLFRFQGEDYFCTYKTLFAANKVWGNSVYFGQMWEYDFDMSFECCSDYKFKNSKYCHTFLMVHRDFQYSSCFNVMNKGFIIYYGATETGLADGDDSPKQFEERWPTFNVDQKFITSQLLFKNQEDAFDFLKYGLYKEHFQKTHEKIYWELNPGEKIVIVKNDKWYECWSPGSIKKKEMREKSYSSNSLNSVLNGYFSVLSRALDLKKGLVLSDLNKKSEVERAALVKQQRERYMGFFQPIKLKQDAEYPVFFDYITEIPSFPISTPRILEIVTEYYIWMLPPFLRKQNMGLLDSYYLMIEVVSGWIFSFRHNNSKAYITDVILKNCEFGLRDKFEKSINLIYSILYDATKYALDRRSLKGEEAIPDNIKFLAKRRYAYEIFLIYQLKMRFDISDAKDLSHFHPEYDYLLCGNDKDKIVHSFVWRENIDKLYLLHQRIFSNKSGKAEVEEVKKERPVTVREFKVSYGSTFSGRRVAESSSSAKEVQSDSKEDEQRKSPPKKITIVRRKI